MPSRVGEIPLLRRRHRLWPVGSSMAPVAFQVSTPPGSHGPYAPSRRSLLGGPPPGLRDPAGPRPPVTQASSGTGAPPPPLLALILGRQIGRGRLFPSTSLALRFRAAAAPIFPPCGAKPGGGGGAPPTTLILLRNQRRRDRAPPHTLVVAAAGGAGGARGGVSGGSRRVRPSWKLAQKASADS